MRTLHDEFGDGYGDLTWGELETHAERLMQERDQLARDVLSLADDGGMPDSYRETDSRMKRARAALEESRAA